MKIGDQYSEAYKKYLEGDQDEFWSMTATLIKTQTRKFVYGVPDINIFCCDILSKLFISNIVAYYDENKSSIYFYMRMCIRAMACTLSSQTGKSIFFKKMASVDEMCTVEESIEAHSIIGVTEENYVDKEIRKKDYEDDFNKLSSFLTPFEKTILKYHLKSMSLEEISQHLKIKKKSVDNALERIRQKGRYLQSGQIPKTTRTIKAPKKTEISKEIKSRIKKMNRNRYGKWNKPGE